MGRHARRWTDDELRALTAPQFVGVDVASGPDRTVTCVYEPGRLLCNEASELGLQMLRQAKPLTSRDEPYAGESPKRRRVLTEGEKLLRKIEREKLEGLMWQHLVWLNLACVFERHARFHPVRKWELDLLARGYSLGVEIHGGTHTGGRHVRGAGFAEDRAKMNAAVECGISILEFTSDQVQDGTAASQIERVLCGRGWKGQQ
jgi:hypothetical protein